MLGLHSSRPSVQGCLTERREEWIYQWSQGRVSFLGEFLGMSTRGPRGLEGTDITSSTKAKALGKLPESTLPPANSIRVKTQWSLVSGTLGTGSKQSLPDFWVSASLLQSQAE